MGAYERIGNKQRHSWFVESGCYGKQKEVMRFNSKSITLNRGVNCRLKVNVPSEFPIDKIAYDVLESSIKDFNNELDKRRQVKELIGNMEVDVLRLGLTAETFYL